LSGTAIFGFHGKPVWLLAPLATIFMITAASMVNGMTRLGSQRERDLWHWEHRDDPGFRAYGEAEAAYLTALTAYQEARWQWARQRESYFAGFRDDTFESHIRKVLEGRGHTVSRSGAPGVTGSLLVAEGVGGRILVRCRAHPHPVGADDVSELHAELIKQGAAEAWLVTAGGFTSAAFHSAPAAEGSVRLVTIGEVIAENRRG